MSEVSGKHIEHPLDAQSRITWMFFEA